MRRDEALEILRNQKPILQERFGVSRIGIFGSVARDEAKDDSDVDVVVDMTPDLFLMVHVKELLEEAFHTPVDVIRYREQINPLLKKRIDRETAYV